MSCPTIAPDDISFTARCWPALFRQAGFGSIPSLKMLGYKSPNEKLNIAAIGAGGKAASDIDGCADRKHRGALRRRRQAGGAQSSKNSRSAPKYKDFRKMLDKEGKNIDAVIVTIPDHMHATAAMWGMERGKHVYVQKPLTRTVWEARQLMDAANKYKVATQMGNQGYSNEGTRQCRRNDLGGRDRQRHRSARLDRPPDLAAGPDRNPAARTGSRRPSIGTSGSASPNRGPYTPAARATQTIRRLLLSALQLARLLRFRLRRARRHGLPHPGRAEHGAASRRSHRASSASRRKARARSCSRRSPSSASTSLPAATCLR